MFMLDSCAPRIDKFVDYELALLDLIDDAGIKFSGNANELIASYAADG